MPARSAIVWNAYPALLAAGAFAAGVCLAEWIRPPLLLWILVCAAGVMVAAAAGFRMTSVAGGAEGWLTAGAMLALIAAGGLRQATFGALEAEHIAHLEPGREVVVTGRVADPPRTSGNTMRFVLRLDPGLAGTTRPDLKPGHVSDLDPKPDRTSDLEPTPGPSSGLDPTRARRSGLVQVYVRPATSIQQCDEVRVAGTLAALPYVRNRGDFDYGRYLRRKRIFVRLFADAGDIQLLGRATGGLTCLAKDVRIGIGRRIHRYVRSPEARGIVRALLLGDRRELDRDIQMRFARTGLLHLLAVSGLHVMVVGMIFYRLLRPSLMRMGMRWRLVEIVRSVVTALLLLAYMVLTGGSASVVRAVVMALLFMGAGPLQRTTDSLNTLGVAALVIMAIRPSHLFEPGFQLSTAAVTSIIVFNPLLSEWVRAPSSRAGRHVHSAMTVTVAATIGTLPIVIAHFGQVALAGLILNLPAVPITTVALSSGIAAVAAGEITAPLGAAFGASTDVLARLLLLTSELGDRYMEWALIHWNLEHPSSIIALALVVLAIARWPHPHHRWPLLIAALAVVTVHTWAGIVGPDGSPDVEIAFLDVGQGDAAVIRLPNGRTLLVDAGPRTRTYDAGERVVLAQLERMGVRRIHTALVTHPDSDHLGGLPAILRAMPVGRVLRSGFVHTSDLYMETDHLLDSLDIPHRAARAGDTLDLDPRVRILVLHPGSALHPEEPNASSIVLQVRFGGTSALLAGDAPAEAERWMIRSFGNLLESDVLKVGHHGSRTSSSAAFLGRVNQDGDALGIVSVAAHNRFGLPDEDVLDRLERSGFQIHSTASAGAVWIRLDGRRAEVIDW